MAKKSSKRTDNGSNGAPVDRPYFLSLTLENVRCFGEKQTLKLSDDEGRPARWTIILGDNGTGKTTLLRALALICPSPATAPWSSSADQNPLYRNATHTRRIEAAFAIQAGMLHTGDKPPTSGWAVIESAFEGIDNRHSSHNERGLKETARMPCFGYGAGRRLAPPSISRLDADDPTATLFDDSVPLRNAEEWLLQLDYATKIPSPLQQSQQQQLEQVRQLLGHILPDVDGVRISTPSAEQPRPRVEFNTPYGWVHLRALGYGYQTLIAWMVDLASRLVERYPDSPDPLAEPAVVLVDEIDLHLHPQWQRKLIGHLTECFPNAQFIVTAHSPLVVQSAGDANIVLLRREGDHVVIDNDVHSVRGWRIDQIYTSELFGLPTARPPEVEALLEKRRRLLEKPILSDEDRREIAELEEKIGDLPAGETAEQIETLRTIEESLELIKRHLETKP